MKAFMVQKEKKSLKRNKDILDISIQRLGKRIDPELIHYHQNLW